MSGCAVLFWRVRPTKTFTPKRVSCGKNRPSSLSDPLRLATPACLPCTGFYCLTVPRRTSLLRVQRQLPLQIVFLSCSLHVRRSVALGACPLSMTKCFAGYGALGSRAPGSYWGRIQTCPVTPSSSRGGSYQCRRLWRRSGYSKPLAALRCACIWEFGDEGVDSSRERKGKDSVSGRTRSLTIERQPLFRGFIRGNCKLFALTRSHLSKKTPKLWRTRHGGVLLFD